jgi:ElaB/YqjD/DUF883 family membrane-anchored ribosome-binding protein
MAQTADEIRSSIEYTRAKLGQHLNDLQYKVKQETDWRVHVRRRPWTFVGVLFAAAMLLGLASSGKARRRPAALGTAS